jgi:zinc/manganese transport system permease protein
VRLTSRPSIAILTGIVLALLFTWIGLAVAYYSPHPVSFFITSLAFFTYLGVRLSEPLRGSLGRRSAIAPAGG